MDFTLKKQNTSSALSSFRDKHFLLSHFSTCIETQAVSQASVNQELI